VVELFDIDLVDEEEPFEIHEQAAHLFKHAGLPASTTSTTCGDLIRSSIRPSRRRIGSW
jgi:hypothetical protein